MLRTSEYQAYFDQHGPEFAAEQPAARRPRVEASQRPLGELGLVGMANEQPQPVFASQHETEQ